MAIKKLCVFLLAGVIMGTCPLKGTEYYFSSESVTEGHPDKVCDQISDALLDAYLSQDAQSRVACETAAKDGVWVFGEITSKGNIDVPAIVRSVLKNIGYTDPSFGLDAATCPVRVSLSQQSEDIAKGVDESEAREQGAGDQGMMFGYACNETPELMPLPIYLSHKLTRRLAQIRKEGIVPWIRPDGKAQVTVKYIDEKPIEITTVVVSTQHSPDVSYEQIVRDIKELVIKPVCGEYLTEHTVYHINPTGAFILGGPAADAGLTGRKIIVDTYGGMGRHGGGAFSGKDPSKVDRSAAYMARHIAKNIVAAGLAIRCEVQIAYSIGVAEPISLYVNTFGTSTIPEKKIETAIRATFPLKPATIIKYLDLKRPIYQKLAAYGHFGRNEAEFTWEKTNKVAELKKELGL